MKTNEKIGQGEFLVTKEYRRFVEFCEACRRYRYIGLCYGLPGVGKTISARHYGHSDIQEYFAANPGEDNPPAEMKHCRTIVYTPTVSNTPKQIDSEVSKLRHYLKYVVRDANRCDQPEFIERSVIPEDCTELIIVDEADRLRLQGLEQMRDIADRSHVGLVLIGMPGIEKRLSRHPQLYSRVGFAHEYKPLSREEMLFILEHKWRELGLSLQAEDFADTEAISAIIRITQGNFRLVQRLFMQIQRLLKINELAMISKEVVEAARENLVIGM
ncbi:MAG: AAA family ATPase, partial [Candidatus Obscuribacterales bacterium]|nr:AAA family ATPase [Candidatus Obscuribacterales bacterium]